MNERVLFVDDESIMLDAYRTFSDAFELPSLFASNSSDALAMLREHSIRLLVTDHNMPGLTGVELLSIVRKKFPKTRRILATGFAEAPEVRHALEDGTIEHLLIKPIGFHDLEHVLTVFEKQQ
jgi:YesN/AraC family two-component response regulator